MYNDLASNADKTPEAKNLKRFNDNIHKLTDLKFHQNKEENKIFRNPSKTNKSVGNSESLLTTPFF